MSFSELMKIKIELLCKIFIIFSFSKITGTCTQINETDRIASKLYSKVVIFRITNKFDEIDGKCRNETT